MEPLVHSRSKSCVSSLVKTSPAAVTEAVKLIVTMKKTLLESMVEIDPLLCWLKIDRKWYG